ncbi:DUF1045 domain-containing protein [Stappia sp.]|uniref:DUF1045 domain-containing protein n=1 Tax=Stappia sp. TaxID=1870903 RepID=UPI003A9A607A
MRYAVYFTPPADHPLVSLAESWLGRSAFGHAVVPRDIGGYSPADRAGMVRDPARYGFHGTLKAPFRLAEGRSAEELAVAFDAFAAARPALAPLPLAVSRIGGFLALTPAGATQELCALADAAVRAFEPFRAPLGAAEIARRNPDRLTPSQRDNLLSWGYPHVFGDFRFHMTLTGRLGDDEAERALPTLAAHFAGALASPIAFDRIALYEEREPGGPFSVIRIQTLAGGGQANP